MLILFVVLPVIFLAIFLPIGITNAKYERFVNAHSESLKQLKIINNKYKFYKIANFDMNHSYDNENFYEQISCEDYLIYQLVFSWKKILTSINNTLDNKLSYDNYIKEISNKCIYDTYDTNELLHNRKKLARVENKLMKRVTKRPTVKFDITVKLVLTNINGDRKTSKSTIFPAGYIRKLIDRVNNKRGNRYLDEEIWQSICRVERGKVTNKMRFAIYSRDNYRCCMCGRKRDDLEIDHIYPISKGGKSTMDNLQTLCHKCNVKKGADIY